VSHAAVWVAAIAVVLSLLVHSLLHLEHLAFLKLQLQN
jgi:hypothetical protein